MERVLRFFYHKPHELILSGMNTNLLFENVAYNELGKRAARQGGEAFAIYCFYQALCGG